MLDNLVGERTGPYSNHGVTNPCRDPLAHGDGGEDDEQNRRDLIPGERVKRSLQLEPQPAGADQTENRGLPDIDVPAKDGDARKGRHHLRYDRLIQNL